MTKHTFRTTLIEDLALLADPSALQRWQLIHPDIDASAEAISSLVDYYTAEVLSMARFKDEFSLDELELLRTCMRAIHEMEQPLTVEKLRPFAEAMLLGLRGDGKE